MHVNTSRPASLPQRLMRSKFLTFGMVVAMLLTSAGTIMAQSAETTGSTDPVTVTFRTLEVTNPGKSWEDANGSHLRGQQVEQELSGDLTGTSRTIVNRDNAAESETTWITARIESDIGPWSYRAIFTAGQDGSLVLYSAALIGHGNNADRTVVFDRILEASEDSLTLTGQLIERGPPATPFTVHFDVCITSPQSVGGAFFGTMADLNGDFEIDDRDVDSGAMEASFLVGGPVESGLVMGHGTLTGEHGTLEFELAVDRYGPHGIGKAVFLGGSGAYAGIFGTTSMELSDGPNEECPFGIGSSGSFHGSTSWSGASSKARVHVLSQGADIYGANGMFFSPDDQLYVASIAGREMLVYDPENGQIQDRIGPDQGLDGPDDVTFGPDGSFYWTDFFSGLVGRMAPDGTVTTQFVAVGVNPITMSDDGRLFVGLAFVADGLYELDPALQEPPRLVYADFGFLNGFDFGPDGLLYAPSIFSDAIIRIDVETGASEVVTDAVIGPSAVKFNSQGQLFGTEFVGGRVVQIDIETGQLTVQAEFATGVDNLAFDSRNRLFVSHATDAFVAEILPDGNVRYLEQPGFRSAGDLAMLSGDRLFMADSFALRQIDPQSGQEVDASRTPLVIPGEITSAITVDAFANQLILSSWFGGEVQVWDPEEQQVVSSWTDFNVPLNAIDFQGDLIVAELGAGQITRTNMNDPSQRETLMSGLVVPSGMVADSDNLWVADWVTGIVWLVIRDGNVLSDPAPIASGLVQPEGMTIDRDGALLVVESGIGRLTRIDPNTGEISTVADGLATGFEGIPNYPPTWYFSGVAVDAEGTIYVTGDVENVIYRIDRPAT